MRNESSQDEEGGSDTHFEATEINIQTQGSASTMRTSVAEVHNLSEKIQTSTSQSQLDKEELWNWIFEFVLKQPLKDEELNALLHSQHFPKNNIELQKLAVLRKLESLVLQNSISARVLGILDVLAEVQCHLGYDTISDVMKLAYCAVAVECTFRSLECRKDMEISKSKFFEAVKEIWEGIIGKMVLENGGLISEELLLWKDEMVAAVSDVSVYENLVKKCDSVNAVEAISRYLQEEKEKIGPSFLEVVACKVKDDIDMQELLGIRSASLEKSKSGEKFENLRRPKDIPLVDNQYETFMFAEDSVDNVQANNVYQSALTLEGGELVHFSRRRRRGKWTLLEENTLRAGVTEYGLGNWKAIWEANREIFEGRTNVDLKDKWRNLMRQVS